MENKQKMIEVQDLCKSFHKLEVLKNISTDFYKNEVVSIIGPSGGGKSTFLRCLNLLEKPTSTARRWAWCSSSSTSSTI